MSIKTKIPFKGNIIRILPDCHWELKQCFNMCGFVCRADENEAHVLLADGKSLILPLSFFEVVADKDLEARDLIVRLAELWKSEHLDKGEVVIEIIREMRSRPYPKITDSEDGFLTVLEDYIYQKQLLVTSN